MGYGFFDNAKTKLNTSRLTATISFIDRQDMAVATLITDWLISNISEKKKALANLGVDDRHVNLASPQIMATWLYSLTDVIKRTALNATLSAIAESKSWLIHAVSTQCQLDINVSETINNRTLAKKMDTTRVADIKIHQQPHQVIYAVTVQNGTYFEFLNQRCAHQTNSTLDQACEKHFQTQIARALDEMPRLIKAIEKTRNELLTNFSKDELNSLYLKMIEKPHPLQYVATAYVPYSSTIEAKATFIAQHSVLSQQQEEKIHPEHNVLYV